MGEGNAVVNRRKTLNPETLFAAGEIYKGALSPIERSTLSFPTDTDQFFTTELHGLEDGSIPATFQIMHMVSRLPHLHTTPGCRLSPLCP